MTTTPISYATAVDARQLPFTDRRTSLRVAGVVLIVLGSLSACVGIMAPIGMAMGAMMARQANANRAARGAATAPAAMAGMEEFDAASAILAVGLYVLVAALFIWTGIGSVRTRRWVRPVMLAVGWTWLITGLLSFVHWAVFGADVRQMMSAGTPPGSPQPPPAVVHAVTAFLATFMVVLMVLFPALLVWVYRRRGVRETLDFFDPRFVWTDRCPTPVLALSGWQLLAAVATAGYAGFAVFPAFGRYVTGAPAVAALLGVAALYALLAWGTYRLRTWAWWGTAIVWTLWSGSMLWTFTALGYEEFYRQAGYSPQQVDMMMRYSGQFEDSTVWMIALWTVGLIGYLLYVRRFFVAGPPPEPGGAPAPLSGTGGVPSAPLSGSAGPVAP